MRHLVYLLLVVNLVYFGWNLFAAGSHEQHTQALPPLPATAKPLVTLQEMQQGSATAVEQGAAGIDGLTLMDPPGAGDPVACQALGPFYAEDESRTVAERLDKLGLAPRQRVATARQENGYWVYLPAMEHARALQIARQLDERNDHEYYIGKDNFMALGTFKEITRAEIRLQQLRDMGLDAILEARYVTQDAYWLEFRRRTAAASVLAEVMGRNPVLQLETSACL